jgi:outer membrane biosynthesis protein TonB
MGWVPRDARSHPWQALGSALGLEVVLIGALAFWLASNPSSPAETFVPLVIEPVALNEVEQPVAPEPPKAMPLPPVATRTQTPKPTALESSVIPPQQVVTAAPEPVAAPIVNSPPTAFATPTPPPQPVQPAVDPTPAYNAKLAAAVQAAFEVPGPALALNFKGRARVEFALHDGVASAIRVIQGSGLGSVDRAAIKAVQSAVFPAPPAALQGKVGTYQIWVACY